MKLKKKIKKLKKRLEKLEKSKPEIKQIGFDYLYNYHDDNDYD
jgi:hypothetical protein